RVAAGGGGSRDADWPRGMPVGLAPGLPKESQFARRLAENGCRVVVPMLIDRKDDFSGSAKLNRWTNQPHREFIYRMAYEMGRHIIGYEVQKVLAVVDWFTREKGHAPVGVIGAGEGGLLAFYWGALDTRIRGVDVCDYFGPREGVWAEPIYRNVWAALTEFGDAELVQLFGEARHIRASWSKRPAINGPPTARAGRAGPAPPRSTPPPPSTFKA